MKCLVCGGVTKKIPLIHEISRYTKKAYPLFKCKNCGFARPDPLPYNDENKDEIYDSAENIRYFNKKTGQIEFDSPEYKYHFKYSYPYIDLVRKYKIKGSLLDVGCGQGHLMVLLEKEGMKVEGFEVTQRLIDALKRYKIYGGDLKNKELRKKKYDLITFNQVLEHIEDPKDFLKDINSLLKDDGKIILAVPYIYGLIPRVLRSYWYGLGYGQHLNFFSKKSIKMILEETNFEVEEIKIDIVDYTHLKFPKVVNLMNSIIMKIVSGLGLGDNMFVVAKKRSF